MDAPFELPKKPKRSARRDPTALRMAVDALLAAPRKADATNAGARTRRPS
jgi:hypothetical protein